jgi:hypothetical protein
MVPIGLPNVRFADHGQNHDEHSYETHDEFSMGKSGPIQWAIRLFGLEKSSQIRETRPARLLLKK